MRLEEKIVKKYGVNELRKMFLDFFETKGHLCKNSYSLVPHNDNSVLLIPAGMAPLKPYFTGQEVPPRTRMATCQKCIRTGDIENVGITARHLTFFEMLGNFSFGDYFKEEAIEWSWEFLTEVIGLDSNRLYPSIYENDEEAFEIWNKKMGIPADRIFRFGKEDNFWEHGAGPCGPCSEIYYDRGEKYGCGKPGCTVGCDCDRYMEIWNNVFTQFNGDGKGNYEELASKNIDTGMGLERLAVVVQDVDTVFSIDTFKALLDDVCALADYQYETDPKKDVSIRVIVDHIRSVTFMVSDGIMPSNEGRGYVLRRLLRRTARHGRLLGIDGSFLTKLSKKVIELSRDGYAELGEKEDFIEKVISQEEEKFSRTIDTGLSILNEMEEAMEKSGSTVLSGEEAFKLYDTYGFPLDLTKEILLEKEFTVDEEAFAAAMENQKQMARKARKTTNYMGADVTVYQSIDPALTTEFVGYDHHSITSPIVVLTTEEELVDALTDGQTGTILTEKTPFYATMGGQHADKGQITLADGSVFQVEDTIKLQGDKVGHVGRVVSGMFRIGDMAVLTIDENERTAICKNHSATHLLQKALRVVLGSHVEQAGSYNDAERLRFDFSHFQAMTAEEIQKVEDMVNDEIRASLPVCTKVMTLEEAKNTGAMALFGEKYGESVRVVSMGDFSTELCGGTHVSNTADINCFKIISESGIAAGVRRIEALTSVNLLNYYADMEKKFMEDAALAKATPATLGQKITQLMEEIRTLQAENEKLKNQMAKDAMGDVMDQVREISGIKVLATSVEGVDMNGLRNLGDQLKDKLGECVLVIASQNEDKVNLIAMATDSAQKAGAHAGNLIKAIAREVGGGGGGRPNMAQAGGKNPAGIPAALELAWKTVEEQLH
ncbi:MAG: alanine--tRNA ligase [Clostridiales bacterium]|nr:alanine--tRNA ligase [Clostridiales bacterium]